MLRKTLNGPSDLDALPSLLGSIFRQSIHPKGEDTFDYKAILYGDSDTSNERYLKTWSNCRARLGL